MQVIITSIHPSHADKILAKKKTIELRRRFTKPKHEKSIMVIYATSPVQSIIGYAEISSIEKIKKGKINPKIENESCVDKDFIDEYIGDRPFIYAIKLKNPLTLTSPLTLRILKDNFNFHAPQSHLEAKGELLQHLREHIKYE